MEVDLITFTIIIKRQIDLQSNYNLKLNYFLYECITSKFYYEQNCCLSILFAQRSVSSY